MPRWSSTLPIACLTNTPWQDVKGKINGFTLLTSAPTGVMLLTRRQPDSPATALNKFCSIRTSHGVYTEFGIDPFFTKCIYP